MPVPGFTAQAALYKTTRHYQTGTPNSISADRLDYIEPQAVPIPVYGNHCGPNFGDPLAVPVDAVDCVCYNHDRCYETLGYDDCRCDAYLINAMPNAIAATPSAEGKIAGTVISLFFESWTCACRNASGIVVG